MKTKFAHPRPNCQVGLTTVLSYAVLCFLDFFWNRNCEVLLLEWRHSDIEPLMLFHRMAAAICDRQWKVMRMELPVKHALISLDNNDFTLVLNQLYINKHIFCSYNKK